MALTISSYAKTTEDAWPFETFPNYESVASTYMKVAGTRMIVTAPFVTMDQKASWEDYSVANQGWIKESYEAIGLDNIDPLGIQEVIYDHEYGRATEAHDGPFLPLWQISGPPQSTGVVNFNLMSNSGFASTYQIAKENKQSLLTEVLDVSEIVGNEQKVHPESLLIHPMFDDVASNSLNVVGAVAAVVSWDVFMTDLVREGNQGMVCVLKNTCGQSYTYKVNAIAQFIGEGDHHDRDYDYLEHVTEVAPFATIASERQLTIVNTCFISTLLVRSNISIRQSLLVSSL
jgi:hypothetical protein